MIVIAGSGPSSKTWDGPITIGTKKTRQDCEYVCVPTNSYVDYVKGKVLTLVHAPRDVYFNGSMKWWKYYAQFHPQRSKPSSGLAACFCAIEMWDVDTIGLIGFENILDGSNKTVSHDWAAEHRCLRSLVDIVDLRNDTTLRRIRPEGSADLSRFLPERHTKFERPGELYTLASGPASR